MKKISFIIILLFAVASCTKEENATNNYKTNVPPSQPAFEVDGVKDIILTNWFNIAATMNISVHYLDSAQEPVTLSLSALPANISIDSSWNSSGVPDFNAALTFNDPTFQGATPGSYPIILTASTPSGKVKSYPFSIKILPASMNFLGKYNNCFTYCPADTAYTDSVYMDPVIVNKIWFANFSNSGHAIYGMLTLPGTVIIPNQTYGGYTYHGDGSISPAHTIQFDVSSSCIVVMN